MLLLRTIPLLSALALLLSSPSQAALVSAAPASLPPATSENACTAFLNDGSESRIGLLCHNNPVNKSDPFGLWSPEAHDKILESALKDRFSKDDLKAVQQASREFDKATQSAKDANKHAMRQAGQSPKDAKAETQRFINNKLTQAREAQQAGDHAGALRNFGEAVHPMDASSPMHTNSNGDPKPYYGIISALGHSPNDSIGRETSSALTVGILLRQSAAINSAADRVFGE